MDKAKVKDKNQKQIHPSEDSSIFISMDRFVKTRGHLFVVDDEPFHVHGFNAYFLMAMSVDTPNRNKVIALLDEAANAGLNVARSWAFNDGGYEALQTFPGTYDEKVFQALDFVISQANRCNIRLILTLVNNWNDYGGKAKYVEWARTSGVTLESEDAFFTDSVVKGYYRNHVKTILTRVNSITGICYKDEPAIFAWELINEARCLSDPSGDVLHAWIEEMASFVKSIDCNHLLGLGSEGFYGPSNPHRISANPNSYTLQLGTDFLRHHQVDDIDFAGAHGYPDSWLGSEADALQQISFIENWLAAHIADCTEVLHKPFLLGEFGVSRNNSSYKPEGRESFYKTIYSVFYISALSVGGGSGGLLWQLFPEGMDSWSDGYQIVLSRDNSMTEIILQHAERLRSIVPNHAPKDSSNSSSNHICPFKWKCW